MPTDNQPTFSMPTDDSRHTSKLSQPGSKLSQPLGKPSPAASKPGSKLEGVESPISSQEEGDYEDATAKPRGFGMDDVALCKTVTLRNLKRLETRDDWIKLEKT